jgi:S-adenosylmethionine:diacylglycerol 3-amino-3-carboxypropyl transferase
MGIVFSRAWEDDRLDADVLRVGPGDRVLVVAGAGEAALVLAAAGARVTAVDTNRDQLRLVALKRAAARSVDAMTAYRLFEVGRDVDAPALYRARIRPHLATDDAAYWDEHVAVLASGLHAGTGVGRPFARLGRLVRILRPGIVGAIEEAPDPATQAERWRREIRPILFGPPFHWLAAHTRVLSPLAPDARELARMRAGGWSHGLVDRIDGVVATVLVRRHPWWRPAFAGRPVDPGDGCAWLDPDRLTALASGPAAIELVNTDLLTALRGVDPGSLAAVSLSNVPDWIGPQQTAALAVAATAALAPGGRLLVRRVVKHRGRDPFAALLERDPASDGLVARERTALYEAVDLYRRPAQAQ